MEVCYVCHCIDLHRTHSRSTTLYGSLLCLSLYRFISKSQQINDTTWKSAIPVIVSIFTELTTDKWHCMEICSAFHCIDFHWTHYRSVTLHVSLLSLSLCRFSPNSQQINDIAWKPAMPVTVSIFTELTTDQWHCMEVCYAFHCIDLHRTHNGWTTFTWKSATPTSINIVTETYNVGQHFLDALHCAEVYFTRSLHADIL